MRQPWGRNVRQIVVAILCGPGGPIGCSLNDLVSKAAVLVEVRDPRTWENEAGAFALYHGATEALRTIGAGSAITSPIGTSALLTDEMTIVFSGTNPPAFPTNSAHAIDARLAWDNASGPLAMSAGIKSSYDQLQDIRIQANVARQYLQRFGQKLPGDFIGHTLAIEAYAIWFLSELFCSGIPLSAINFDGTYVLGSGTSHDDALAKGIRLLDSADAYLTDSARIAAFAHIVRGKILMSQGRYDDAATAVQNVAPAFVYPLIFSLEQRNFFVAATSNGTWQGNTIANGEGTNGLNFVSSGDPRSLTVTTATNVRFPARFKRDGSSPIILMSGVEAMLLKAEASLHSGNVSEWLRQLNALRNSGITRINVVAGSPPDTVWTPGLGAVLYAGQSPAFPGLADLVDPGSDTARVTMLFRERAFWLFLTGNRQADLRRLVRQYKRPEDQVYPVGRWGPVGLTWYGGDVQFPVPDNEEVTNGNYLGCISRDA